MESQKKTNITEIEKRLEELRAEKEELLQAASEIEGTYLSAYEIRPAGRHVLTIGEGEAATRNSLTLTAVQRDSGAHFILSTDE